MMKGNALSIAVAQFRSDFLFCLEPDQRQDTAAYGTVPNRSHRLSLGGPFTA
jgi:hypothetical protein